MKKILLLSILTISILACNDSNKQSAEKKKTSATQPARDYMAEGKKIVGITFAELSGRLQKAMKEGGVKKAVSYCKLTALPLVDSLSKVHNVQIKRTSSKVRNPLDVANPREKGILEEYEKAHNEGQAVMPQFQKPVFYAPIIANELCLKCHGKIGETLTEENYHHIQKNYPEDQAVGYATGDFRGMWVVDFESSTNAPLD